ncbi:substrate-binding periplasmic protein [Saccharospirillum salsuginis]|uniref:Solute-binding protein family 3/N-terminal domain-containing protein n=1 Tax=Saccharospirillum salsuginis TaxID=418750 RepID=A0A918KE27_9GAMM|nr:transporter substrate-binding domain-containing protein [Saccharospirillum salsuginis]GGX57998.1 hypothetical protein GCM10007392_27140 [Saccharospirillum salsuginis]
MIRSLASCVLLFSLICQPALASVDDCPVIHGLGAYDWEPISYYDSNNTWQGVMPAVLREVGRELGFRLNDDEKLPWKRALLATEAGTMDVLGGAYFTEERARQFYYSTAVTAERIRVFTRSTDAEVTSLAQLSNRQGVRPAGGSYGDEMDALLDQLGVIEIRTGEQMLQMVSVDRADYGVLAEFDGLATRRVTRLDDDIVMAPLILDELEVYYLFSRRSSCADWLPAIDQVIDRMREEGVLDALHEREVYRLLDKLD